MSEKQKKELITLQHVTKTYHDGKRGAVFAVSDVSFDIMEGEVLGLVGESGCGKSTIGNLLVHLLQADSGTVLFRGQDITRMSERSFRPLRKDIQMIFQDPYSSLNPKKKIGWLLEEVLSIHHKEMGRQERKQKVNEMLCEVGLDSEYAQRYPNELSGGQRQRVAIALALMTDPDFIVADEAVSALDVSIQAQILNLLRDIQKKRHLTCLFISHDLGVVSYLADRIGVMYLGRIVEIGTAKQIAENPLHPYTKALFGRDGEILQGDIPSPSEILSGCSFNTRCPYSSEKCKKEMPQLWAFPDVSENIHTVANSHFAACHNCFHLPEM